MNELLRPVRSSLGSKYLMAITGLGLIGFVLGHMGGNLLIFAGSDALNSYAAALKERPALLWVARLGLLAIFVIHIAVGLRLTWQNKLARPVGYVRERTVRASWASRNMLLTGLVLLAFVVYHLAHFTFGVVDKASTQSTKEDLKFDPPRNYLELAEERFPGNRKYAPVPAETLSALEKRGADARQDVYSMVIAGFSNPWITLSYLIAMIFLALHLWHGGSSWFQSLGLNAPRWYWLTHNFGPVLAVVVFVGNCSIPLAVLIGVVK